MMLITQYDIHCEIETNETGGVEATQYRPTIES